MEQKNKTLFKRLRLSMWIVLFLFIAAQLGDIISVLIFKLKHGIIWKEMEIQPLFILGVPMWVITIIKLAYIFFVLWIVLKKYFSFNIYARYSLVYVIIFITLITGAVVVNNFKLINKETEDLKPIPKEKRIEVFYEDNQNLKVINNLIPAKVKGIKIPLFISVFLWNLTIFVIWADFEKCKA